MKSIKKISLFLILIFVFSAASLTIVSAGSDRDVPLMYDTAGLLSESERKSLDSKLEEISEERECEVAIVTVYSLGSKSPRDYADDFFDYNGYGYGENDDGILLLVSMEYSDWWVTTHGFAIKAFSDSDIDRMADEFLPYLGRGEYRKAFSTFADLCDEELAKARADSAFFSVKRLVISLGVGVIFAFIITGIMKSQLKSVRYQPAASNYVRKDSININVRRDLFLFSRISRRPKPQSSSSGSSTHRSSSGRTHGGRGGKF